MTKKEQQKLDRVVLGRRAVLHGAALSGVAVALAGCGSDDTAPTPAASATESTPKDSPSAAPSNTSSDALAATEEVPVNGGVIVDETVVVTQPEKGTFMGFSAICTHKGCVVATVADGVISCPCHGSQYSVADGSVLAGPAPAPLPEVAVVVKDGQVVRA